MDTEQQMILDLVNGFPGIKTCLGRPIDRWDPEYLLEPEGLLADYHLLSNGVRHVIDFALQVWDDSTDWEAYGFRTFSVTKAYTSWDPYHRTAFAKWAANPFFP